MLVFYRKSLHTIISVLVISLLLIMNACDDRLAPNPDLLPESPIYALNDVNQLMRVTLGGVHEPIIPMRIVGTNVEVGERIMSIDFRPATGQLYGVSNKSRLFIINPNTAEARPLTTNPFSPGLTGSVVGIDFNPAFDRIRLISTDGQDFWLNPETGLVTTKNSTSSSHIGIMVSELAYTNNRAGVLTSVLYNIDPATDRLYTQTQQSKSNLTDVGALGLDIAGAVGFDITPDGNGLVAVTFNGSSELQQINLATGRLRKLGNLPGAIIGLAAPTEPVAYAIDSNNNLLIFNPLNPLPVAKPVTGLQAGEQINGLDFRPSTGQLYALSSSSRLYTLNTASGIASAISKSPLGNQLSEPVTDFRFTPTVDRIRLTMATGHTFLLNPVDGEIDKVEQTLNQSPPDPIRHAYTLLRTNDSTRIHSVNPINGSLSTGILLPGNPVVRGFTTGLGF
ncbi:DUF4394 domain-containing protein [Spirosoma luteum]|uniref:DUF4394 domain-containing protein n=1 Tax=Spirosoma luteum TaxID=431553 RepID=UPI000361E9C0|nr:DUF4394 domain-containing protein [Spirosoma luteum]